MDYATKRALLPPESVTKPYKQTVRTPSAIYIATNPEKRIFSRLIIALGLAGAMYSYHRNRKADITGYNDCYNDRRNSRCEDDEDGVPPFRPQ
ncbi:hypothetical protein [Neisseria yangbaofengii]|uniref:hypothetical protein n=1 Tax=Neisseria yangbaofengii TaxID=2709396 RepID=UPI0013ED92BA|nr:hypothetical protein [Neisseria yangbaofengii]